MVSFTSLLTALPLAAATVVSASASSHYSHAQQHRALSADLLARAGRTGYASGRTLPRSGRRLHSKRAAGQATLKCLTDYTFALCDGDNCTDMGAVVAGTMCKDGAITWDSSASSSAASSASSSDSSAGTSDESASPSSAAPDAASSAASAAESSTAVDSTASANEVAAGDKKLANNAVQADSGSSSSSSSSAPSSSSSAAASAPSAVQLNAQSSPSGSSDSSDEDDWECDAEDESSSSSTTTAAVPASTSASSSDVGAVQLNQQAATSTTTAAPRSTTTTSSAAAQTSSASSSSGSSSSQTFSGRGTYYLQYGVAGSCGTVHSDSDYIIALSASQVDGGKHCGQKVQISNSAGKTIEATVADTCPGCAYQSIDLSEGAFKALGTLDQGVLQLTWHFL